MSGLTNHQKIYTIWGGSTAGAVAFLYANVHYLLACIVMSIVVLVNIFVWTRDETTRQKEISFAKAIVIADNNLELPDFEDMRRKAFKDME